MTDQELLDAYVKAANDLSYYNAAEGDSYWSESSARNASRAKYTEIKLSVIARGLELPK